MSEWIIDRIRLGVQECKRNGVVPDVFRIPRREAAALGAELRRLDPFFRAKYAEQPFEQLIEAGEVAVVGVRIGLIESSELHSRRPPK